MKVVALVRTLNEQENIQRFISRYAQFCDHILISDSGSEDATKILADEMAEYYPKGSIMWSDYTPLERIYVGKDKFYTRQPNHINYLFSMASRMEADWAIYADCDLVPTFQLIDKIRDYMEDESYDQINCRQYHIYGYSQYFPELTTGFAPWAFRLSKVFPVCDTRDPRHMGGLKGRLDEENPKVKRPDGDELLLHYFAQNESEIQTKMDYYNRMHRPQKHPLERCGRLEDLPRELI